MKKCIVRISLMVSLLLFIGYVSESFFRVEVQAVSTGKFPVKNLTFTLTSVDEVPVCTKSEDKITVIIFGRIRGCSNTTTAVSNFSKSGLAEMDNVRVIFADVLGSEIDEVSAFAQAYSKDIIFCYDINTSANHQFKDTIVKVWNQYMDLGEVNGGFPLTVLIDSDDMVQDMQTGAGGAATIISEAKELAGASGDNIDDSAVTSLEVSGTANYDYVKQVVTLVNEERAKKNLSALTLDKTLLDYAMQRAAEISWNYDRVGHKRPDGNSFSTVWEQSRGAIRMSENIAMGYSTPKGVMSAWVSSTGHYANIMDSEVTSIGVGCFKAADGYLYWVQLFDNANADEPSVSGTQSVTKTISIPKSYIDDSEGDPGTSAGEDIGNPIHPETSDSSETTEEVTTPDGGEKETTDENNTQTESISNVKGVKVTTSKTKSVTLSWKKVSGAEGYLVYQYNNSKKKWNQIATTSKVSYTVKSLTSGTSYRFAVKAYLTDKNDKQVKSESYVSVKTSTIPDTVTLKVTAKKKEAAVSWSKVNGATGYIVYYKTSAADPWKKLKSTTGKSYIKKGLKSGKKYYFTVQAYRKYNGKTYISSLSKQKSATIK
ncbi:MAG: hypothetical protein HDT39_02850 [Lachnospiraceae bacterium]|nr:hypothetical protein [Lachnospiraceae bacterium]